MVSKVRAWEHARNDRVNLASSPFTSIAQEQYFVKHFFGLTNLTTCDIICSKILSCDMNVNLALRFVSFPLEIK